MKTCLLIVDVQKGFINSSTSHIPGLVENLQKDYKYVYATRFFNRPGSFYRTLIKWDRFDIDSEDFGLAFTPLNRTRLIDKSIYTCINAEFLDEIKKIDINEVHVCGIDTDICVTKCAVDLFESGVEPKVLAKYSASHAGVEAHKFALATLERFIGKGQIIR